MKPLPISAVATFIGLTLLIAICSQVSFPFTPTMAEAAVPAAPPKKVDYPQQGKVISVIVPWPAGGTTDVAARLTMALVAKDIGVPVQIVDKPGAGGQLGTGELAMAKPDGYTIGSTINPSTISLYLDPVRKANFGRKSFAPIAALFNLPIAITVPADSPYKGLKDLIEDARANPEKIKAGATAIMGPAHLGLLLLEKAAGVKFASVHFDGAAPQVTALLGHHIDVSFTTGVQPQFFSGELRALGLMSRTESKAIPGVKTCDAQGYKVYMDSVGIYSAPAGMPKEMIDILAASLKKAADNDEHKKRLLQIGFDPMYLGPEETAKLWDDMEAQVTPIMASLRVQ